jgi:rfaE bifunctional protein nucleotidyltransferase chain/domain
MPKPPYLIKKLIEPDCLAERCVSLREGGSTIATLNGSFDLLHAGHLFILYEASRQADCLIVALNSDLSVQQYKGSFRPIVPLRYRLEMMAAIEFVHFVTWFDEVDPRNLIQTVRPHVHVNGKEYGEHCVEAEAVKACGARLHLVDRIPALATSHIIEKIKQCG